MLVINLPNNTRKKLKKPSINTLFIHLATHETTYPRPILVRAHTHDRLTFNQVRLAELL